MMKFYDKLALARKNFTIHTEKDFLKIDHIFCQLYDIAEENSKKPGELPNKFFLVKVGLTKSELDKLLHDIGIDATITNVNSGGMYGDMYQVDLN